MASPQQHTPATSIAHLTLAPLPGVEIEASPVLKGDSHVTDRAHYYPATRVRWWWWLLRISEVGNGRRRRNLWAGPDHSGALLRVRRNAYAPLRFGAVWWIECPTRRRAVSRS